MKYLLLLFLLTLLSCHKANNIIFWEEFDGAHIDHNLSDKGFLGSYRTVFWESKKGSYPGNVAIDFAVSKGWRFSGTEKADTADMAFMHNFYVQIVNKLGDKRNKPIPDWFRDTCTVYKFTNEHEKPKGDQKNFNGYYIYVSADGSKMCVYNWEW